MNLLTEEHLVAIFCEIHDRALLLQLSRLCKSWNHILRNSIIWEISAKRRICEHLKPESVVANGGNISPSDCFLHDLSPALIGFDALDAMSWIHFADLLTSPLRFRMTVPKELNSDDFDQWLDTRVYSLLNAASIQSAKKFSNEIFCRFVPVSAIAVGTYVTQAVQPHHLHFWGGTDSYTQSHHILARLLTIFRLDDGQLAGGSINSERQGGSSLKCLVLDLNADLQYCHAETNSVGSIWSLRALRKADAEDACTAHAHRQWIEIATRTASLSKFPPQASDCEDCNGQGSWVMSSSDFAASCSDRTLAAAVAALTHPVVASCIRCLCRHRRDPPLPLYDPEAAQNRARALIAAAHGSPWACTLVLASPADARAASELRRLLIHLKGSSWALAGRMACLDNDSFQGVMTPLPPAHCSLRDPDAGRQRLVSFAISERPGGHGRVLLLRLLVRAWARSGLVRMEASAMAWILPAPDGAAVKATPPSAVTLWRGQDSMDVAGCLDLPVDWTALAEVAPILLGQEACDDAGRIHDSEAAGQEALRLLVALARCEGLAASDGPDTRLSLAWVEPAVGRAPLPSLT
jgi:hypothetical protein